MVKRQKEKQYQSAAEYKETSRFRSGKSVNYENGKTRRLPFNCCALTLTTFTNPVCAVHNDSNHGIIFENSAIVPYLVKYQKDPVTGSKMTSKELITLNFDKDENGKWQCPVLCKPFQDNTKIVAIRQNPPGNEANVYSFEAVQELNFKPRNYTDLTSGNKFHKAKDVILLQDPNDQAHNSLRDINNFQHLSLLREERNALIRGAIDGSSNDGNDVENSDVRHSITARRIMEKLKRKRDTDSNENKTKTVITDKEKTETSRGKNGVIYTDELNGVVQVTSGKCSGSFTSTAMTISSTNAAREATEEEILQSLFNTMKKMKKKGYVRMSTNLGNIEIEIHCDIVPRTSMNFLGLAEQEKYNGTKFHRSIRNFMIQGGKPIKSASNQKVKEESIWGGSFEDEFDDRLKHAGSGILSMANAGAGTNKCQFFITYKSAPHLDRKHSVFGQIISGSDVLKAMENVPTDPKDYPKEEIKILHLDVLVNPIHEAKQIEEKNLLKKRKEMRRNHPIKKTNKSGKKAEKKNGFNSETAEQASILTIGKYLPKKSFSYPQISDQSLDKSKNTMNLESMKPLSRMPPPPKKTKFGDFSNW